MYFGFPCLKRGVQEPCGSESWSKTKVRGEIKRIDPQWRVSCFCVSQSRTGNRSRKPELHPSTLTTMQAPRCKLGWISALPVATITYMLGARFALSRTNNPIYVLTLPCIHTSVPDMMTMLCVYYFDRQHLERDSNAVCMYVPSTGSRLTNVHPSVVQYVWSYQRLIPGDRSHAVSSCLDATHNVWFAVCYLIGLVV